MIRNVAINSEQPLTETDEQSTTSCCGSGYPGRLPSKATEVAGLSNTATHPTIHSVDERCDLLPVNDVTMTSSNRKSVDLSANLFDEVLKSDSPQMIASGVN